MFEKNLRFAYLLDFYGAALDEHTEAVMKAYYDDDLSLAEVAEGVGISRQGVRHIIKRGEEQLDFFEQRLGLAKRHESTEEVVLRLRTLADALRTSNVDALTAANELTSVADAITDNE